MHAAGNYHIPAKSFAGTIEILATVTLALSGLKISFKMACFKIDDRTTLDRQVKIHASIVNFLYVFLPRPSRGGALNSWHHF
jgi:hypothetical protein